MKNVQSSHPRETHNQYRNRVGRISRHQHLMSQNVNPSKRRKELKALSKASIRIENKVKKEIEEFCQESPTVRHRQKQVSKEKQIAFDKARGAYESRTFLEETLRLKGIEPAADIEEMMNQYEEWKALNSRVDISKRLQTQVTDSQLHNERQVAEATACLST